MLGTAPIELGLAGHEDRVYRTLAADRVYQPLFAAAFPGESTPVTTPNVAAALSAFERSIVSFRSPFDRYREYEDRTAMSESAMRGSVLFFSNRKARCISCHRGLNLDGGSKTVNTPPAEESGVHLPQYRSLQPGRTSVVSIRQHRSLRTDRTVAGRRQISRADTAQHRGHRPVHARRQHRHAGRGPGSLRGRWPHRQIR